MRPIPRRQPINPAPALPSAIDAIADGLSIVVARPLLMAIPLLLDLYYWLGWKLTAAKLTAPIEHWIERQSGADSKVTVDFLASTGRSNIMVLLSSFVPVLLTNVKRSDLYTVVDRPALMPSAWMAAGALVLVLVASVVLGMAFFVPLADDVTERRRAPGALVRAIAVGSVRLIGVVGIAFAIIALVTGPLLVGSVILAIAGIDPSVLLALALLLAFVIGYLGFCFVPEAIVISDAGPLRAIANSYAVVRHFFWQTLGLILATIVITAGLGSLFGRMADTPPGLLLGVVGNAFFGTGLELAAMGFYASRIRMLKPDPRLANSGDR